MEYVISMVFLYLIGSKNEGLFICLLLIPNLNTDIYWLFYAVLSKLLLLYPGNDSKLSLGGSVSSEGLLIFIFLWQ